MSVIRACCFTGHRPDKFSFKYNEADPECLEIKGGLKNLIEEAINNGYNHFISGMALGVDTWAAEAVLELKEAYPGIKLEAAIPCIGQDSRWIKSSRERYANILKRADIVTTVVPTTFDKTPASMNIRNVYMVNNSSLVIAIFDGGGGGTKHAFDYAKQLCDVWQLNPKSKDIKKLLRGNSADRSVLECSSVGDPRFSSLFAYVEAYGKIDFIENHYQLSKRFEGGKAPKNRWEFKGKTPVSFEVDGREYDVEHLTAWFKLLWCKYLDANPKLVLYAKDYDDFRDTFAGKAVVNSQADVVKQYVKKGRRSILDECSEFIKLLKEGNGTAQQSWSRDSKR